MIDKSKTAVVIYNLGGPNKNSDIKKFLFNLFYDKSIINLRNPFRYILAKFISTFREKEARLNYDKIGGKSPLLENTLSQKQALEKEINPEIFKVFICMNHMYPMPQDTIDEIEKYSPSKIILLPLFPQFSTTTTGSFIKKWDKEIKKRSLKYEHRKICCYFSNSNFIKSYSKILKKTYIESINEKKPYIIFVAHGLPKKIIDDGDPYQWQVENTVLEIIKKSNIKDIEYILAYQSRVGPISWIKPYADEVIIQAAKKNKNILVIRISFVSEHVETLVELDIEYKELAINNGAYSYTRAPTVSNDEDFINALKDLIINENPQERLCPKQYCKCIKQ
ncbi:MAG: ferrochelatase [Candidatus Midichloriaceae bacterium]|jgi:ferrochelatase